MPSVNIRGPKDALLHLLTDNPHSLREVVQPSVVLWDPKQVLLTELLEGEARESTPNCSPSLWFNEIPNWFIIGSVLVSCVVLMWFRFGTHWPHCGQVPVQFRSDVVLFRFKVGSSLDSMCFKCESIWVQIKPNVLKSLVQRWFKIHAQLVHSWFDGCSDFPSV